MQKDRENVLWMTVSVSGMLKSDLNSPVFEAIASAFLASDIRLMNNTRSVSYPRLSCFENLTASWKKLSEGSPLPPCLYLVRFFSVLCFKHVFSFEYDAKRTLYHH
jgi:hypothetical protein